MIKNIKQNPFPFIVGWVLLHVLVLFIGSLFNISHISLSMTMVSLLITPLLVYFIALVGNVYIFFTKDRSKEGDDERTINIRAYHEAGHFFIAMFLGLPVKEVHINYIPEECSGGQVVLDLPIMIKASQIRSLIMVTYAGFLAEKMFIGEASTASMGADNSDMERANRF